jgi:hypothetical protein
VDIRELAQEPTGACQRYSLANLEYPLVFNQALRMRNVYLIRHYRLCYLYQRQYVEVFSSKGRIRLNMRGVKHARPRSRIGDFSALHRPDAPSFGVFSRLGLARAKGDLSAQGLNRIGSGIGGGSGQLESIEGPRRCLGRAEARQRDPLRSHWRDRCAWNDLGPELGVGREHAMEANAASVGATGTLPAQSMDGCFT